MSIIRGTTPTIKYTFQVVDPSTIVEAFLTIKQFGTVAVEKDISTMTAGESFVTWELSQADTLALCAKDNADIQLRYRTLDGTAYASLHEKEKVVEINKDGEI